MIDIVTISLSGLFPAQWICGFKFDCRDSPVGEEHSLPLDSGI